MMDMLSILLAVLLVAVALGGIVLRKTYFFVPIKELKRQAEAGDAVARSLYPAAAYGGSLRVLLWLVIACASAGGFLLLAKIAPAWLGFIMIAVLLWLVFSWLPNTRVTAFGARLAAGVTPSIAWLLNWLHPVLSRISQPLRRRYLAGHTGLFEREDLFELLEQQAQQPDSRITPEELDLVRHVLNFGAYKVRDVLRPRNQVKAVSAGDAIGPILLDELHLSGQTSFPVKKSSRSKEIVGTLHLSDVGIHSTGTVSDYMHAGTMFIHESDNLAAALHVFYQTKRQLFIVTNSFQEYVGVITLEDILHQLVGRPEPDEEMGSHDDIAAVSARWPQNETETAVEAESVPEPGSDYVEEEAEIVAEPLPETEAMESVESVSESSEEVIE